MGKVLVVEQDGAVIAPVSTVDQVRMPGTEFGFDRRAVPIPAQAPKPVKPGSLTKALLVALEREIESAMYVLRRLPGTSEMSWLAAANSSQLGRMVQQTDDEERPFRYIPTGKSIDEAFAVIELLFRLDDVFVRRMIVAKASKMTWSEIMAFDSQGRSRRTIFKIYREALVQLHEFGLCKR